MPDTVTMIRCLFCPDLYGPLEEGGARRKVAAYKAHLRDAHGYNRPGRAPVPRVAFVQVPVCPECGRPSPGDQKVWEGGKCALCSIALEIGKVGPELGN